MMRFCLLMVAAAMPMPLAGQVDAPRPEFSVMGGATSYDLSGTGNALAGGMFVDYPLTGGLRIEAGSGFMRYRTQGLGPYSALLFPEMGVRLSGAFRGVAPYIGAGFGTAIPIEGGGNPELTLHGLVGMRFLLARRLSLKGEFRVRSVDPFTGTTADVLGGLAIGL